MIRRSSQGLSKTAVAMRRSTWTERKADKYDTIVSAFNCFSPGDVFPKARVVIHSPNVCSSAGHVAYPLSAQKLSNDEMAVA